MGAVVYKRDGLEKIHLFGYKCNDCGTLHPFWEKYTCGACRSTNLSRFPLSGKGRINYITVIHYPPPEFKGEEPYMIVELMLDEGLRISGRMVEMPLDQLKVGDRVRTTFRRIKVGDEGELYYGPKFEKDE